MVNMVEIVKVLHVQNYVEIGSNITEISRFFDIQHGGRYWKFYWPTGPEG